MYYLNDSGEEVEDADSRLDDDTHESLVESQEKTKETVLSCFDERSLEDSNESLKQDRPKIFEADYYLIETTWNKITITPSLKFLMVRFRRFWRSWM
jgi:hypothetical protein